MTNETPPPLARPIVGVLHPGAMGAALGAALKPVAGQVIWAAADRSQATSKRAENADLVAVPDLAELARRSDVIISICPPHAALNVAEQVADAVRGRTGPALYVDANAVAPATVRAIGELLGADRVVDGAVIGGPAWERGGTVLWLSGRRAGDTAALFDGSPFDARALGPELGPASALKACFALQSKALPMIWLQLVAAARVYGVEDALRAELTRYEIDLPHHLAVAARVAGSKAWRWSGEMEESAASQVEAGLPGGFAAAAAELYRRLADGEFAAILAPDSDY